MPTAQSPVLLTGAAGNLGTAIIPLLLGMGWTLRLTDLNEPEGPLPAGCSFVLADLADPSAIKAAADGTQAIVHLGAFVDYGTLETVMGPNIIGVHSVFEAAETHGIRVVNASSNHVIGFYDREEALDIDARMRPDSYYGLSKAYGEMVARFYFDRYRVPSVSIRIGSCFDEPKNERMLATWLSRPDLARIIDCSLRAEDPRYAIIWGVSDNAESWWKDDDRARIGWAPNDSADPWRGGFDPPGDGVADRCQGGRFCAMP